MDINYCSQRCSNTVGSYVCSCFDGYRLGSDGETCNGTISIHHYSITTLNTVFQISMSALMELTDVVKIARIHLDHTHAAVEAGIV